MNCFFNLLVAGTRSLSFEYEPYKPKITLGKPRTPAEILREVMWDVGVGQNGDLGKE